MIVKTFDEILTYLNDKLDEFIAAKSDGVKILRTNNNIFYLLQKADSKGYELIQAFLGPVRAGFYQAFAWAFGASLKKKYDPEGIDRLTERVVLMVEAGQI